MLDRAFAAVYDRVLAGVERAGLAARRRALVGTASGRVLEIGAGTGANLEHLPNGLASVTLAEPSPGMRRRLARRVVGSGRTDVTVVGAGAETLPFPDAAFDTVVSTLTLCTVDDPERVARELRRVLAPQGRLLLIEHVTGTGATARWQRRIEPVWRHVARGCRLTRDTRATLSDAGFDVSGLSDWSMPGGGVTGPAIIGVARAPA